MSKVLIVGEQTGGVLGQAVGRAVACAKELNPAEVTVALFGAGDLGSAAQAAAALEGVTRVVTVDNPANANPLAALVAPQVVALTQQGGYGYVLAGNTSLGKDTLPRVAALLGVPQVTDIMQVLGARSFKRPTYAGNAIITVEAPADHKLVATVRTASFEAAPAGGTAAITAVGVDVPLPTHTRFVSVTAAKSDRPDLQSARKVVSGGRALGSQENFQLIYSLADRLGAAVGASRAAVDAGYAPNELQVGQTGKIIAPELYVAVGISGAIQHLTGIKDARTIVAINKDAEAPIFEIADFGLVGDLFAILPELERQLAG
jgi:electron transfer flavoprotein alpha subunit